MVFEAEACTKMLDSLPCGICQVMLDDDLTILYANQFYYELYGYTAEHAVEEGFINVKFVLPEKDFDSVRKTVKQQIAQGKQRFQIEYHGMHRSGKLMWLLVHCAYDPGKPESILCAIMDIAERKRMEEELRISMEENRIAYELTDKMLYVYDIVRRQLRQPKSAAEEFGLPAVVDDAPYSIAESGAIDEDSKGEYITFYEAILRGEPNSYAVVKKRRRDGSYGWYEGKSSTIYDGDGNANKAIISCEDITEQREKELSYQKWRQYFKLQEGRTIGVYEYNLTKDLFDGDAEDIPPNYLRPLKKYTQTIEHIAKQFVHEADLERFRNFFDRDALLARYHEGQMRGSMDYLHKRRDGSLYWARAITLLIEDPYSNDVRLFIMNLNIDNEKREALNLRRQTEYDGMTGLLNRETFSSRVEELFGEKHLAKRHALIMLDIDQFKTHNDVHGHPFGDQVIRETAQIIRGFSRNSDLCGRMGGDEFIVLLNDITSQGDVMPRIDMLCNLLRRNSLEGREISCSMGIAFYPEDGETFQELYQKADKALYEAKNTARGRYKVYGSFLEGQ